MSFQDGIPERSLLRIVNVVNICPVFDQHGYDIGVLSALGIDSVEEGRPVELVEGVDFGVFFEEDLEQVATSLPGAEHEGGFLGILFAEVDVGFFPRQGGVRGPLGELGTLT